MLRIVLALLCASTAAALRPGALPRLSPVAAPQLLGSAAPPRLLALHAMPLQQQRVAVRTPAQPRCQYGLPPRGGTFNWGTLVLPGFILTLIATGTFW